MSCRSSTLKHWPQTPGNNGYVLLAGVCRRPVAHVDFAGNDAVNRRIMPQVLLMHGDSRILLSRGQALAVTPGRSLAM
jgi:hypothetical protein